MTRTLTEADGEPSDKRNEDFALRNVCVDKEQIAALGAHQTKPRVAHAGKYSVLSSRPKASAVTVDHFGLTLIFVEKSMPIQGAVGPRD